jgi:hypothetical protein
MASRVAKQNIKGEPKLGIALPTKGLAPKNKGNDKEGEKQKKN